MNRGRDYVEGLRPLHCDWCRVATMHDTHRTWLHCRTCLRCYSCGDRLRCGHCTTYEKACDRDRDGVVEPEWLDQALIWIRSTAK